MRRSHVLLAGALWLAACGDDDGRAPRDAAPPPGDGPAADAGEPDGGALDAEASDAGAPSCRLSPEAGTPPPVAGRCAVVVDEASAHRPVGPDGDDAAIVLGGRRVTRVGRQLALPGFPIAVLAVPGTSFVVVADGGVRDNHLRVVDVDTMTVVAERRFARRTSDPEHGAVFDGLALSDDHTRLWVSGSGSGVLHVFSLGADGSLSRDEARSASFVAPSGDGEYLSGLAYVEASATVAIASMFAAELVIWDAATSRELRRVALPESALPYGVVADARGERVYVSDWAGSAVYVVDPAAGTLSGTLEVGKNPEGLALSPDGGLLAVAASDGDSVTLVDTTSRTVVTTVPIVGESAPRGASPAQVAWSGDGARLLVASAGDNAIDVFSVAAGGARVSHAGRIPTTSYPTDVDVLDDGRVVFVTGKHEGAGPNEEPDTLDIEDLVRGSVAVLDPPGDAQLAAWDAEVAANNRRPMGFAEVSCPAGAGYDFPIPQPGRGPSALIRHVVVVVRENKTYDAYYGDLTDAAGAPHGNGDPTLAMLPPGEMDVVLPNSRRLARDFVNLDNYYASGDQSTQGHFWTAFGRTTDFMERTYPTTSGRSYWTIPPGGTLLPVGYPEEGSIFRWLERSGIDFQNYNEIVASADGALDPRIPGGVGNGPGRERDIERARYLGRRWADECRMPSLSYVLLPNDHTQGGDPGAQTPRSMLADNDEAVGFLVDALSHSTLWASSVVFVVEDDPQSGGDHVENHRSPALVISPWAPRGRVSSVHYSEPSVWRTVQLILGIDEPPNAAVEVAAPMLDAFTSTPDFSPWSYTPRQWPEETNPEGTRFAIRSRAMDFSEVDRAEGLSRLLWEMLRGTPPPWPSGDGGDGDPD